MSTPYSDLSLEEFGVDYGLRKPTAKAAKAATYRKQTDVSSRKLNSIGRKSGTKGCASKKTTKGMKCVQNKSGIVAPECEKAKRGCRVRPSVRAAMGRKHASAGGVEGLTCRGYGKDKDLCLADPEDDCVFSRGTCRARPVRKKTAGKVAAKKKTASKVAAKKKTAGKGKRGPTKWNTAVSKARKELGVTGFVAVKKGTDLYKRAKELM